MTSRRNAAKEQENSEHMPEILVQLRNASGKCLESSIPYAHGGLEDAAEAKKGSESCMQMIQLRKQMKQQLMDLKTSLQIRGLTNENIDSSLSISLDSAHAPLEHEMFSLRNKELVLMRMKTFATLLNVLEKKYTQRPSIMALMTHSMNICSQIMALQLYKQYGGCSPKVSEAESGSKLSKSNRQLEEELTNIRKSRKEMRTRQQELFKEVKNYEKTNRKIHDVEMKTHDKGRESLQSVSNKVIIIQEVFQRFILSVKVNWAEDPHLTSLLLRMREPVLSE